MSGSKRLAIAGYGGGKMLFVPWIYGFFPPHKLYCEPFGGYLSVLLNKNRSPYEVVNDLDGRIVNLYRVLADPDLLEKLQSYLSRLPMSDQLAEWGIERLKQRPPSLAEPPDVEMAAARLFLGEMGYAGMLTNRLANRVQGYLANREHYAQICQRLRNVAIQQRDAISVIREQDRPDTFFFIDPPYIKATAKGYGVSMGQRFHQELVQVLSRIEGRFLLCGFPNPLYDEMGWYHRQRTRWLLMGRKYPNASVRRVEGIWANYSLDETLEPLRKSKWWNRNPLDSAGEKERRSSRSR